MNLREALKLYVIPDSRIGAPRSIEEQAELALDGGATMIQLRDKKMSGRELYETACRLSALCRSRGAAFVVNDGSTLPLPQEPTACTLGRKIFRCRSSGGSCLQGFSSGDGSLHGRGAAGRGTGGGLCGNRRRLSTGTKTVASVIGVGGVRAIREALSLPSVAIGGISEENAAEVLSAGVDGIAVVSSVVGRPDIAGAARRLAEKVFSGKP